VYGVSLAMAAVSLSSSLSEEPDKPVMEVSNDDEEDDRWGSNSWLDERNTSLHFVSRSII
jgi:hypothetical protein